MDDVISLNKDACGGLAAASKLDDELLLSRFANGDAAAAHVLTERLGPRSYSVALRMLGNRADAEDVAQDAMMRLWKIAPDWQSGKAQISTWLYRVTCNLCLDLRRRKMPGSLDDVMEPVDETASITERMQDMERLDALQAALEQLPDRQRQAVILRHIEELSNPEIATIMDISVEAVESLTARGKRVLAGILAKRRDELGYENG